MSTTHSSFWLPKNIDFATIPRIFKLSIFKKAVDNFIDIITNNDNSIVSQFDVHLINTDIENKIILSGECDKNLDATIGLAIFETIQLKYSSTKLNIEEYIKTNLIGLDITNDLESINTIYHFVEDLRLYRIILDKYNGYAGYLQEMIVEYKQDRVIDKILRSNQLFKTNDVESYLFRLLNIQNANNKLSSLPGLQSLSDGLDIKNIDRLKNSEEALLLSIELLNIIKRYTTSNNQTTEEDINNILKSEKQTKRFVSVYTQQRQFDPKKTKISIRESKQVDVIKNSGTKIVKINDNIIKDVDVIVIDKLTEQLINSKTFNFFTINKQKNYYNLKRIEQAIRTGKQIANQLQLYTINNNYKNTRLKTGKIDQRLVANLGYNDSKIFYNYSDTNDNKDNLTYCNISIDGSSSMEGDKFENCLSTAVSIIVATTQILGNSIHIKCNVRYTNRIDNVCVPVVLNIFDSKTDTIYKIKSLFQYLKPNGHTPEGLCFNSIIDTIDKDSKLSNKKYFINFSDGEPYYETKCFKYENDVAIQHTKKQVDRMKLNNIKVLSYYVSNKKCGDINLNNFKAMYGNSAIAIDVNDIRLLTKSLNERLITTTC
jgi:hypothetical protein